MLYEFTTKFNSIDIESLPQVKFNHGYFSTEDEKLASRLRKIRDVVEITEVLAQAKADVQAEQEPPKKRGRPPKTVAGMRTVDVTQKENEE